MRRSAITNEWISHYEQLRGIMPAAALIEKVDVIFWACDRYREIGSHDHKVGKPAITKDEIFMRLLPIARIYNERNTKQAKEAADLLHDFYLLGYESTRA